MVAAILNSKIAALLHLLSVVHMDRSNWFLAKRLPSAYLILRFKEILVATKIKNFHLEPFAFRHDLICLRSP